MRASSHSVCVRWFSVGAVARPLSPARTAHVSHSLFGERTTVGPGHRRTPIVQLPSGPCEYLGVAISARPQAAPARPLSVNINGHRDGAAAAAVGVGLYRIQHDDGEEVDQRGRDGGDVVRVHKLAGGPQRAVLAAQARQGTGDVGEVAATGWHAVIAVPLAEGVVQRAVRSPNHRGRVRAGRAVLAPANVAAPGDCGPRPSIPTLLVRTAQSGPCREPT